MTIHDDLQKDQFQNTLSPHEFKDRDKLDFQEGGVFCRFEGQIFTDVDSHLNGIIKYETLKRNNIEKINDDLYSLFSNFWDQNENEAKPEPEPEHIPEPEPQPVIVINKKTKESSNE